MGEASVGVGGGMSSGRAVGGGWGAVLGNSNTQIPDKIALPKACEKNHKFTCLAFCA
jgi:hypothetical protein